MSEGTWIRHKIKRGVDTAQIKGGVANLCLHHGARVVASMFCIVLMRNFLPVGRHLIHRNELEPFGRLPGQALHMMHTERQQTHKHDRIVRCDPVSMREPLFQIHQFGVFQMTMVSGQTPSGGYLLTAQCRSLQDA